MFARFASIFNPITFSSNSTRSNRGSFVGNW
jgi:hypothetical protein